MFVALSMNDQLKELEDERACLQRSMATPPQPRPVHIHPNLAEVYRRRVAELETLLADSELGTEAMNLIRSMITEIKIAPRSDAAGVDLIVSGDLARILWLCAQGPEKQNAQAVEGAGRIGDSSHVLSVVTGRRSHLYRTAVRF